MGTTGCILDWINYWLHNIKQRAVLNGVTSVWSDAMNGVIQGGVLGSTLFIIFINDLEENLLTKYLNVLMMQSTGVPNLFHSDGHI